MEVYNNHSNNMMMGMNMGMGMRTSGLNPHAQPYVPAAHRAVEDFSPEWWQLVQSSPCFTDYWLRECFHDDEDVDDDELLDATLLPDDLDFFAPMEGKNMHEEKMKGGKYLKKNEEALITWGSEKWMGHRINESPKYAQKVPKIVNVKVSPRTIQQPK